MAAQFEPQEVDEAFQTLDMDFQLDGEDEKEEEALGKLEDSGSEVEIDEEESEEG